MEEAKYGKTTAIGAKDPITKDIFVSDLSSLATQKGGTHYKDLAIQPVVYNFMNHVPAIESSIIRYATRHREKNGAGDIEKIIHYAKILLQLEYGYTNEQINEL